MKGKIIKYVKEHPGRTIFITFLTLIVIPPLFINVVYKIPAFWWLLKNEIPAGNLLSYFGTVLTFCATFSLSVVIFLQNQENIKNSKIVDNETFITINDDSVAEITLFDKIDLASMILKFNVIVLSKAAISEIYLENLTIEFERFSENSKEYSLLKNALGKTIHFQRLVSNTELSLTITKMPKEVESLIKSKKEFVILMDMLIFCNNVVTPVSITAKLTRQQEKSSETHLICSYQFKFITYGKPFIAK